MAMINDTSGDAVHKEEKKAEIPKTETRKTEEPKSVKISATVLPILFKESGDEIRHYSTVRATLTASLTTVAATALSGFFNINQRHAFLVVAGYVFLTYCGSSLLLVFFL